MVATKIWTAEELEAMGEEGLRFEIIRGELREVDGMGYRHGGVAGQLHWELGNHIYPGKLGRLFSSDTRFVLPVTPPSTLAPDISFVRRSRLPSGQLPDGFPQVAPDLVVEIVSPSNTEPEMLNRVSIYLAAGVLLIWLVRPAQRTITVFRSDSPEHILKEGDVLTGEPVLSGFHIPVVDVFS